MKFLCDSCKAKYQIADEKVAGKTVRMKCRKCGHQIEVRAAVTETSVAQGPPKSPAVPAAPRTPQRTGGGLATNLSREKPRSPSRPPGALANAFQRNVSDSPASVPGQTSSAQIELSVTDEWYVAINGVPVGPVRISELRRKAAAGAVTEDSLCWQEGLEEWRPIKSIPDLATLVREAALGNRPSLIASSPEAPPTRSPSVPSAPQQPRAQRVSAPPPRPVSTPSAPMVASNQRSNVVPLRPAASFDDMGLGPSGGSSAAATALAPSPSFAPPPPAPVPVADPFAFSPFQGATAPLPAPLAPPVASPLGPPPPMRDSGFAPSLAPAPSAVPAPGTERRGGVPLWFWPILVLALGFGGGVAFLVFRPQPTPAPVVIQMPPNGANAPPAANTPGAPDVPPPPASGEAPPAPTDPTTKKPVAVASKGGKAAPAGEEKKGIDLGGLVPGSGGPNVGPGGAGPSPGGGGLDSAAVERVVAVHRNGVKRSCFERTGETKSVNVTVTAIVAPNGSVSSTSSSGDNPVVAKCIETQVKTWQFSAPGAQTTVNIPFKFVAQ